MLHKHVFWRNVFSHDPKRWKREEIKLPRLPQKGWFPLAPLRINDNRGGKGGKKILAFWRMQRTGWEMTHGGQGKTQFEKAATGNPDSCAFHLERLPEHERLSCFPRLVHQNTCFSSWDSYKKYLQSSAGKDWVLTQTFHFTYGFHAGMVWGQGLLFPIWGASESPLFFQTKHTHWLNRKDAVGTKCPAIRSFCGCPEFRPFYSVYMLWLKLLTENSSGKANCPSDQWDKACYWDSSFT